MNINLDIHGSKDIIYVNQNDTSEGVTFYIKDNGTAVDLTGLTVYFILKKTSYITTQLSVVSASSGTTSLTLTSAMVATSGTIVFEVVGTTANDETAFRISSYMVVQNVYSGDDGPNADDEVNPGIDVLYGEDSPDDETDGEDKDFYLQLKEETADVLEENDYTSTATASNPIEPQNWVKTSRNEFSFDIYGKPNNVGEGEYIYFNLHGLVEGHTYTITFKFQFASGATFPWVVNDYLNICGTRIDFAADTQEHTYTATFTYEEGGLAQFGFPRIQDNAYFTAHITNLTVTGDFSGEIEDLYNKKDGYWKKYTPHEMIGATASADGQSGTVPQPTIADKDKFLKGDGTWAEAQGASAVSDLTDVELTNLADKEILEWDAEAEKWKNVANSGGGGGNALILDAQIYSLEEKQVGVWIDGKPLYQKVFDFSSNPISLPKQQWLKIDNMWAIQPIYGRAIGIASRYALDVGVDCDDNDGLYIRCETNYTGCTYVIIVYTKSSDSAGSGGYQAYGFSPIIYSTEEREVGVWVDNKPLYQKSIVCNPPIIARANTWTSVTTLSENINVIKTEGVNIEDGEYVQFPFGGNCDANNVLSILNDAEYPREVIYVTIWYTKTTDVAGSGKYNTLGVPTVHYDTTEQVIGTFLGKTLYQKTFDWSSSPVNIPPTWSVTTIDSSNIERVIECKGHHSDGTFYTTDADPTGNSHTKLKMRNNGDGGTYSYVTLQYTKIND